jgi:hypothetical protein
MSNSHALTMIYDQGLEYGCELADLMFVLIVLGILPIPESTHTQKGSFIYEM